MQQIIVQPQFPNKVQARYLLALGDPNFDVVIFDGGAGSGKTVGQCIAIQDFATQLPSNNIAVVRKTKKDLKATIQKDFFEAIAPALVLEHNKEDQITKIRTEENNFPSEIHWRGLDEIQRWGSTHFAQIFVEEASELEVTDYTFLITRLRHRLSDKITYRLDNPYLIDDAQECMGFSVRRFISLCYNPPEDAKNWLYELTREGTVLGKKQRLCHIHSTTMDNYENLDSTYKRILENLPLHEYNRMVLGHDSTGVRGFTVAYQFDPKRNTFREESNLQHVQTWFTGHDLGWVLPNKLWAYFHEGSLYVVKQLICRKLDLRQFLNKECPAVEQALHADAKYVDFVDHQHAKQHNDKSRDTSEEIMRRECGRNPQHSFSRPEIRGELINELFRTQRLWIDERLQTLINCLFYGWVRDDKGEIIKDGYWEHIADSFGYLVWGIFKGKAIESARDTRRQVTSTRTRHIKESLEGFRRSHFNLGRNR